MVQGFPRGRRNGIPVALTGKRKPTETGEEERMSDTGGDNVCKKGSRLGC